MSFGRSKHDLFIHKNVYDLISKFLYAILLYAAIHLCYAVVAAQNTKEIGIIN